MRARYRKSETEAEPVEPGVYDLYDFDRFYFVARRIEAGSKLRMIVFPVGVSLYHPRNRNSGGVVVDELAKDSRIANIRVKLGEEASFITLPFSE